jgi:hypothetical protein
VWNSLSNTLCEAETDLLVQNAHDEGLFGMEINTVKILDPFGTVSNIQIVTHSVHTTLTIST